MRTRRYDISSVFIRYLFIFSLVFGYGNKLFAGDIDSLFENNILIEIDDSIYQISDKVKYYIPHSVENFHIHFKAPIKVSYSLFKNMDRDTIWKITDEQNIEFKYLSPGNYVLALRSVANKDFFSVFIEKQNPFWRSVKFNILVIIILIAFFYGWYVYNTWKVLQANRIYKQKEITSIEVAKQKEELTIKNKNITDSINYARRIQLAMIPSVRFFNNIFKESFIFFKPKDIVSGDFFWITEKKDKVFVAAVDCTGHGVPGAFMSIIGIELLRKLVNSQGIEEPSEVLNELNRNFAEIFKDVENITLRDGMDVAFCIIDRASMILEFAGAFNPLYLIRDNKITEIKGDRFSVGLEDYENGVQSFTNHHIQLHKNDMIYIFTDGYSDQFGGPEGKKFKYRRFRHLLLSIHRLPLPEQREQLERSMEEWKGENDQVDDILVIGMKVSF